MRSRRRRPLILLALVLATATGIVWFQGREPEPVAAPPANETAEVPVVPAVIEKGPSLPLPPPGQPLSEIVATLQQRADAGDRAAACRLGVELLACEQMERRGDTMRASLEIIEQGQTREGKLERADSAARSQLDLLERQEQCRLRDPALKGAGFRYLRQAALAGDRDAVIMYAGGSVFTDFSHLQDDRFDIWRREVPDLLQRELRRGNTDAVWQLHVAHTQDHDAATGLIADDPVLGAAYEYLHQDLSDLHPPAGETSLDAAQTAEARALARRWHREYFGGRIYPAEAGTWDRVMIGLVLQNPHLGKSMPVCDPAPQRAGDVGVSPGKSR